MQPPPHSAIDPAAAAAAMSAPMPGAEPKITAPPSPRDAASADLLDERAVGDAEQHEVDRLGDLGQRRDARESADCVVLGVHQMHGVGARALEDLAGHPASERVRPIARADDGDRAWLEHPTQRGINTGAVSLGRRHRALLGFADGRRRRLFD